MKAEEVYVKLKKMIGLVSVGISSTSSTPNPDGSTTITINFTSGSPLSFTMSPVKGDKGDKGVGIKDALIKEIQNGENKEYHLILIDDNNNNIDAGKIPVSSGGSAIEIAELQDIRVGADGTTYESAGKAVRSQVKELKENLTQIGLSAGIKIEPTYVIGDVDDNGNFITSVKGNVGRTEKFSFYDARTVTFISSNVYFTICAWDSNDNYMGIVTNTVKQYLLKPKSGYKYVIKIWYGEATDVIEKNDTSIIAKTILDYEETKNLIKENNDELTNEINDLKSKCVDEINELKKCDVFDVETPRNLLNPIYKKENYWLKTDGGYYQAEGTDVWIIPITGGKVLYYSAYSNNQRILGGDGIIKRYCIMNGNTVIDCKSDTAINGLRLDDNATEIRFITVSSVQKQQLEYDSITAYQEFSTGDKITTNYNKVEKATNCFIDIADKMFIQKGGTLELFKYGMYYCDKGYEPNRYNIRVVNIDNYATQYDDKIVISCPSDYTGETLRNPSDLPLFQLLDSYGKVIDQKRVTIYVGNSNVDNTTRKVAYLGDSLTGMSYRTKEMANLLNNSSLTNTKLIGKFTGDGAGNRFTGTGGYSWANYAENPDTLPAAYPNNYLWDTEHSQISMKTFVESLGETTVDYVFILLGWNDYESGSFASSFSWDTMKQRAKRVIENIHSYYPYCKIVLESYHYMYPFHRKAYGNTLPQIRQNKYIYDLNKFYQNIANEYDYVEFLQMSYLIDVIHNMKIVEEPVNKRSVEKVKYCIDTIHPAENGFYQYSDAEFSTLLYLMQ